MGLLSNDHNRREVKEALRKAGRPLNHKEIADRTKLDVEETREIVSNLVDKGELKSTLNWKYTFR